MAMNPTYLLLDEPFAGLDPQGRGETVKVIRGLATQGFGQHTGILVALTDLDLALQLADALLIVHEGHAAWQGTVAEYVAHPPAVEQWGLRQPDLIALAMRLRATGWCLRLDDPSPEALSRAIAAHVRVVRR
jgi:ABC-type multidrug transport system ATPase subunit